LGRRRVYSGRILRPGHDRRRKYLTVALSRNGDVKTHYVHDPVAAAFIGPKPKDHEVRHGRKGSGVNWATNLCYGTSNDNHLDMLRDETVFVRPVRRSDGKVFPSVRAGAKSVGLCKCGSGIIAAIKGTDGCCLAGGYEWVYVYRRKKHK